MYPLKSPNMKRTFIFTLLLAASLIACKTNKQPVSTDKITVTVAELLTHPDTYVGKEVMVEGTVSHVCKKDGKKMFLFGTNPDSTVRITTGPDIAAFDVSLEGTDVMVDGIMKELRIDEAYVARMEAEMAKGMRETEPAGEEKAVGSNQNEELSNVEQLRKEIKESGKGYISDYWIENVSMTKKAGK